MFLHSTLNHWMHGRYQIPEPWPYQEARRLFKEPLVTPTEELPEFKWNAPDEEVKTCLSCFALASTLSGVHEVSLLSMLNLLLISSYKCILTRHVHVSCRAWRSFWLMKMASTLIELQRLLSPLDVSWFHIFLLVSQILIILLTFAGNREDQGCKEQILTRKVCYFNQFKNLDGLCYCWCFRECKPSFRILKNICMFMN